MQVSPREFREFASSFREKEIFVTQRIENARQGNDNLGRKIRWPWNYVTDRRASFWDLAMSYGKTDGFDFGMIIGHKSAKKLVCIDIDSTRVFKEFIEPGQYCENDEANRIVETLLCFDPYIEVSHSRRGLHIIFAVREPMPEHGLKLKICEGELFSSQQPHFLALSGWKMTENSIASEVPLNVLLDLFPDTFSQKKESATLIKNSFSARIGLQDKSFPNAFFASSYRHMFDVSRRSYSRPSLEELFKNQTDKLLTYKVLRRSSTSLDDSIVDSFLAQRLLHINGLNEKIVYDHMMKSFRIRDKWFERRGNGDLLSLIIQKSANYQKFCKINFKNKNVGENK